MSVVKGVDKMNRAEVRNGYVYVIDTDTNDEKQINVDTGGTVTAAQVTGDDEVTVSLDSYGGSEVTYRISTGFRA